MKNRKLLLHNDGKRMKYSWKLLFHMYGIGMWMEKSCKSFHLMQIFDNFFKWDTYAFAWFHWKVNCVACLTYTYLVYSGNLNKSIYVTYVPTYFVTYLRNSDVEFLEFFWFSRIEKSREWKIMAREFSRFGKVVFLSPP